MAVRHVRRDGMDLLKKLEKDGHVSEDEVARNSDQVQKATDQTIQEIDQALAGQRKRDHAGLMTPVSAILPAEAGGAGPNVPRHVAIIMDGTDAGRPPWPAALRGHRRGVEAVRRTVRASIELGIAA